MRSYRPEELFDDDGRLRPGAAALAPRGRAADERQPARQRRPAAARSATCRTSATTPSRSSSPAVDVQRGDPGARRVPARRHRAQPRPTSGCSARTRPPPTGSTPSSRRPTGPGTPSTLPGDEHLAPDGRVMEVLSEHLCQGWLEGYLLTGRHGLFNCYEAFIHIVDSMFNQHAKWLKTTRADPVAAPDRVAELSADLARLAPGPQRLLPPGPRLHRPRRQQEGRGRPRLPAAGRQHPAVGGRSLPAQPQLRQRHRRRQAARAELPRHGRGDRALHPRARHLGVGQQRRDGEPDVVLACAGDVPTLETLAAADMLRTATARPEGPGRSTSST